MKGGDWGGRGKGWTRKRGGMFKEGGGVVQGGERERLKGEEC